MTVVPAATLLTLQALHDDEQRELALLLARLDQYAMSNAEKDAYYEAEQRVRHMGIAMPPEIAARISPVVGWAATTVDVLEERLDWYGWDEVDDDLGLRKVYTDNALDVESGLAHLDSLLYGVSFVRVGTGREGEPSPLVTIHSARTTTGVWDARSRRLTSAVTVTGVKDGQVTDVVLDVVGQTITLQRRSGTWVVTDRDEHRLDRVPVARMPNRPRASRTEGKSEITKAVRYYCDAAVRTVLGMEGNREFYGIPQLTLLGRGPDAFVDANGNPTSGWRIVAGHALAIDRDDEGLMPDIKQLQVGSPQPFLEQVKGWAQLLATEVGQPVTYFGFQSDNPASADAIRAMEARLVKRAERRQVGFGRAWMEVARLALMIRDKTAPADLHRRVANRWRNAATPTTSATADAGQKQLAAVPWLAETEVGLELLGLDERQAERALGEQRRKAANQRLDTLVAAAGPATAQPDPVAEAGALKAKADALDVLIRAGVDPQDAAQRLGLAGIKFTGAIPTSLRLPVSEADELETA